MTAASLANIIAINDKLIRLISKQISPGFRVDSNTCLQGQGPRSLDWRDHDLEEFIDKTIPEQFGVQVERKRMRLTMNGSSPAVGDLSISIFSALYKQKRHKAYRMPQIGESVVDYT
jgi:hypothetical protein